MQDVHAKCGTKAPKKGASPSAFTQAQEINETEVGEAPVNLQNDLEKLYVISQNLGLTEPINIKDMTLEEFLSMAEQTLTLLSTTRKNLGLNPFGRNGKAGKLTKKLEAVIPAQLEIIGQLLFSPKLFIEDKD